MGFFTVRRSKTNKKIRRRRRRRKEKEGKEKEQGVIRKDYILSIPSNLSVREERRRIRKEREREEKNKMLWGTSRSV